MVSTGMDKVSGNESLPKAAVGVAFPSALDRVSSDFKGWGVGARHVEKREMASVFHCYCEKENV